ncbi:hypothetical protein CC80DRAFT_115305 [Byssothecium circinans]|uniref:Uncharacterized protein n=1 Tax=Byssothecium circinans TaxID=147558 RepID=A0A6A5TVN5_9PLEO|nr:hypothetical protein CC80DRAFT_115305 [Byssothecium circinans]
MTVLPRGWNIPVPANCILLALPLPSVRPYHVVRPLASHVISLFTYRSYRHQVFGGATVRRTSKFEMFISAPPPAKRRVFQQSGLPSWSDLGGGGDSSLSACGDYPRFSGRARRVIGVELRVASGGVRESTTCERSDYFFGDYTRCRALPGPDVTYDMV